MIDALFSIHDVMPETLGEVEALLEEFRRRDVPLPALLVVPGRAWTQAQVDQLRALEAQGAELIAHGWAHETTPKSLIHRIHAALISRNVAEHLAYDRDGVLRLMQRSHGWFLENGLSAPGTYIPPAWALGINRKQLAGTPYRNVEVLGGVLQRSDGGFSLHRFPLLGFEADSWFRAAFLRLWNDLQEAKTHRNQVPLRISIHPYDAQLRLAAELCTVLDKRWNYLRYDHLDHAREMLKPYNC